ncbi:HEXXH motif domain-containing protein [Streptomyces sp. NPDC015220]|uniref:HEXXH motif domain-containing protein n=1 Tax=Streptomyces sp. NPDC015220 TaxID=3364947 RepID=UPI0036FC5FDF
MTLRVYRLSERSFDALARGGGGAEAVGLLADAEYGRRLLLLRAVLDRSREHGGATRAQVRRLFGVLAQARHAAPEETRRVLAHPSVGPRLVTTWQALRRPCAGEELPLASVAAAAAAAAGLDVALTLSVTGPRVVLPGVGAVLLPGAGRGTSVRLRAGTLEYGDGGRAWLPPSPELGRERPGWWPLRTVAGPGVVLDDTDAVATAGPAPVRVSREELRAWRAGTADALRLLRARHAEYAGELAAGLRSLVPVPTDDGDTAHHSGSSAEMFGGVALSRPAGVRALAETLVHEMQHSKLLAVTHLVDLLVPAGTAETAPLHYAPWRDDPRPLSGLLHGAYAFLSVARFWAVEAAAEPVPRERYRAQVRCARWRAAAAEATDEILADGGDRLTPTGRRFVTGMAHALTELGRAPLPAGAVREARRQAEEHRDRWRSRNDPAGARHRKDLSDAGAYG